MLVRKGRERSRARTALLMSEVLLSHTVRSEYQVREGRRLGAGKRTFVRALGGQMSIHLNITVAKETEGETWT